MQSQSLRTTTDNNLFIWGLLTKRKLSSRGKHSFLQKNQYISDVKIYSVNKEKKLALIDVKYY